MHFHNYKTIKTNIEVLYSLNTISYKSLSVIY